MPLIPCFNCNPRGLKLCDPECAYCNGKGVIATDERTAEEVNARIAAENAQPFALARYPMAIAISGDDNLCVLANDGTMWWLLPVLDQPEAQRWERIPGLPQP